MNTKPESTLTDPKHEHGFTRPISGPRYFLWGLGLFALKFGIDTFVSERLFEQDWDIRYYFSFFHNPLYDMQGDLRYWFCMVLVALPFMGAAVYFTSRRLATLGWPRSGIILLFVPVANTVLFYIWSLWPSPDTLQQNRVPHLGSRFPWLKTPAGSIFLTCCVTFGAGAILYFATIYSDITWGYTLFFGGGFIVGFLPTALQGAVNPLSPGDPLKIATVSTMVCMGLFLGLGIEGLICVIFLFPLLYPTALIGAYCAYFCYELRANKHKNSPLLLVLPLFIAGDLGAAHYPPPPEIEVRSEVVVHASPEAVWDHVVAFPAIDRSNDINPLGYPRLLRAEIEGEGPGALRRCIFTHGEFEEPVVVWDPGRNLTFGVQSQPPVFDSHMTILRGRFLMEDLGDGTTRLVGSTWYRLHMRPAGYFQFWTDYCIHAIHLDALNHIRKLSEAK